MSDNVFDLQEFMERVQNDKELLLELLDIFTEDYKTKRQLLGEAIEKNDYEQVRSIAHSLKGATGNISAKALRETLMQIEDMAKRENLSGIDNLLVILDSQYGEFQGRIEAVRGEGR